MNLGFTWVELSKTIIYLYIYIYIILESILLGFAAASASPRSDERVMHATKGTMMLKLQIGKLDQLSMENESSVPYS